ncbi:hypothetical protein [Paracoccus sp. AS002]|uniref:hypothetical protein n=1 Tax=Paracoccus sp. AS002 TaxID=3019545 RepID=UPI0023E7B973|nr:hypothetical protein [Paracoccus sp. AS002]MDF3904689.1 hypothetical protein [Paracoccus sp. AS002]
MSRAELQYLVEHPDLNRLFDDVERAAIEEAVRAPINDDETRRNLMAEVRAIRSVRRKLRHAVTLAGDTEA